MQLGDRLVVAFVKPQTVGSQFRDWPLHVTIVPWFRAELPSAELQAELTKRLQDQRPFEAVAGEEARFGSRRRKLVNLIKLPSPFEPIEAEVRRCLHEHGAWLVDESTKRRQPYRPHVTAQPAGPLQCGDTFLCDRLCIIEQKGDHKVVSVEIKLTGPATERSTSDAQDQT